MVEDRNAEAFSTFVEALDTHGGRVEQLELVVMDMSVAYRQGAWTFFPKAKIIYDHFHLMQLAGRALDEVRQRLQRDGAELKGSLWTLRGNVWTRNKRQQQKRELLCKEYPKLGRAMMLHETLQDVLSGRDVESLQWWCQRAMRSRLEPFKRLAKTIQSHWDGVVAFMETRLTNGLIEAINGLLQLAKRLARGFRSFRNFQAMAYLKTAKLKINLPHILST